MTLLTPRSSRTDPLFPYTTLFRALVWQRITGGAMPMDGASDAWSERELSGCTLADDRLVTRLRKLLLQMGSAVEQSIPLVCQDWANTKAAYRFFSNERAVKRAF